MASFKKMPILGEKYGSKSRKGRGIWFHFKVLRKRAAGFEACFEPAYCKNNGKSRKRRRIWCHFCKNDTDANETVKKARKMVSFYPIAE